MDKKNIKIVQMHSVILNGDAVSNVMRALDEIHKERKWESNLLADLFSESDNIPVLSSYDYDKTPLIPRLTYLASRFIRLDNKTKWLK